MVNIEIYIKENCPFCKFAKELLFGRGLFIREILVHNDIIRNEMINRCGRSTVPQIFFGNKHIGGWDELNKLNIEGKLDNYFK